MHVISKRRFNDAAKKHPNQADALAHAFKVLNNRYHNPEELKAVFPSLDNFKYKDKWWVIDIGGNHLRLIAFIGFENQKMFVRHIVTHAEYDKLCAKYAQEAKK